MNARWIRCRSGWNTLNVCTTDSDDKEIIGGGMMKRQTNEPIINYIGVDSVDRYSKKVQELGGKVVKPKTEVHGFG